MTVTPQRIKYINDVSRQAFRKIQLLNNPKRTKEIRCLVPSATCFVSGKRLFGRKAILVECLIDSPIGPFFDKYYFLPKQYTLWALKEKI